MIIRFACWYSAFRFAAFGSASGLVEQVEELRVVEAPLPLLRAEERSDEVVRVAEVARPADAG